MKSLLYLKWQRSGWSPLIVIGLAIMLDLFFYFVGGSEMNVIKTLHYFYLMNMFNYIKLLKSEPILAFIQSLPLSKKQFIQSEFIIVTFWTIIYFFIATTYTFFQSEQLLHAYLTALFYITTTLIYSYIVIAIGFAYFNNSTPFLLQVSIGIVYLFCSFNIVPNLSLDNIFLKLFIYISVTVIAYMVCTRISLKKFSSKDLC